MAYKLSFAYTMKLDCGSTAKLSYLNTEKRIKLMTAAYSSTTTYSRESTSYSTGERAYPWHGSVQIEQ